MGCVGVITGYLFPQLQSGVEAGFSFLQNLAAERILNLINLGKNARRLAQEMKQLADLSDDLVRQVEAEEVRPRMQRTRQVAGWIERVEQLDGEVGDFQASFKGRTTLLEGCSFGSACCSNYELGQKAADQLVRVGELRSQGGSYLGGGGGELVTEGPPDAVVAVSSSTTRIVGGGKILSEIRRHLKGDDGVGIVGIYGMGGAGKTTYLTAINNEFLTVEPRANDDFEVVIWVTVSKDPAISRIQEDIGVRLGYSRPGQGTSAVLPSDPADRRDALSRALGRKSKFLLLLDDLWDKLDLEEIGIPRRAPEGQSAVVFTTRSKDVCIEMEAQKMLKVDCLDEEDSWELFGSKVGAEVDLNNSIPSALPLAEEIVRRCGGLPLALVTVGRAMAGAATIGEWEDAVAQLRAAPEEVRGMEDGVLSILKFSFDKLRDDFLRHCLLYCSLYPEDHAIDTGELVEYWVGEGFLDTKRSRGLDDTRRRGRDVIRRLKAACLLESAGRSWGGVECVKMHDVVRDMALWLTNGEHGYGKNVLSKVDPGGGGGGSIGVLDNIDGWGRAKRISFFSRGSDKDVDAELPSQVPTCPNLETLLLGKVKINKQLACRDGFVFKFMPALRVLNLSDTGIEELPKEIGLLVGLQYLDLRGTNVRSLPRELGNLAKLRQLNLRRVVTLERIPGDAILRLAELQMLDIFWSGFDVICEPPITETGAGDGGEITLRGMERALGRLEELGIDVTTSESLEVLVTSNHLSKCTRFLSLLDVSGLTASQISRAFERLGSLREMSLWNDGDLGELTLGGGNQLQYLKFLRLADLGPAGILVPPHSHLLPRLRQLQIWDSHGFRDLTWIQHLPCLETVLLANCHGLEELLLQAGGGEQVEACSSVTQDNSFPSMKVMSLTDLPRLRILTEHPLLLPSLETLHINRCPELKKLPFGAHSAKKLRTISGPQEWWNGLEWGGGHDSSSSSSSIKDIFLDNFRPRA